MQLDENQQIYDKHACALGEGAFWHPERQSLFWVDILNARLHCAGHFWAFDEMISAMAWVDADQLLLASESALRLFNLKTESLQHVCDLEADNPITRSNDGRADPYGGFWIGTMGKQAETGAGSIWRYYRGELRCLYKDITISNAICFTADAQAAYFTDTATRCIQRVQLDAQGWPCEAPKRWIDLSAEALNPDGAVVDAQGNLWVAQWGASRVAAYSASGHFLRALTFPAAHLSCPAFGGPDLTTLFCTSALQGIQQPTRFDGLTFWQKQVAQGLPEYALRLS